MFQIKICGVRLKSDVEAAATAGADAIGLNFVPTSVRRIDPRGPETQLLVNAARGHEFQMIGVFVDEEVETIDRIATELGLTAVQLHGDEPVEAARDLIEKNHPVIRAIKLPVADLSTGMIREKCGPWRELGCHLLLDATRGPEHGGTGLCLDWDEVARWAESQPLDSWTLAGGLTPSNVGQAIKVTGTNSVDTASGVEERRGEKSPAKIADFVAAARQAFAVQENR